MNARRTIACAGSAAAALAATAALLAMPGCARIDVNLANWWTGKPAATSQPATTAPAPATRPAATTTATNPGLGDVVRQYAAGKALGAEHGANFIAYDTLAYPKSPVDLAVKLLSPHTLKPLAGVTVAFTRETWVAARVTTDTEGIACFRWTPPQAGNFTFTARVVAVPDVAHAELLALSPAEVLVAAREKNARLFVIDLDHTVVDSGILRVLADGGTPMADSVEVANRLAGLYGIVYLTNRPDLLIRRSKAFLKDNGYPPGPLLASRLKTVLGGGNFKMTKLADLRKAFPGTAAGVGDTLADVHAYTANGMTAYLLLPWKDKPGDLRKLAAELRALNEPDRLQVVATWRELEQAVFQGQSFPPQAFVDRLARRAQQLEAPERGGKKD